MTGGNSKGCPGRCKACGFNLQPNGISGVCMNAHCAIRGQTQSWGVHAAVPPRRTRR